MPICILLNRDIADDLEWPLTAPNHPIWILPKQEDATATVSGSGISWAVCKSAPCSRQKTMPAPHHSDFYRPDALPAAQSTESKHCSRIVVQVTWMMGLCSFLLIYCSLLSVVAHGGSSMIVEVHLPWELLVVLYFTPLKASGMHQA